MKLFLNAVIKYICGVILTGLLLFLPAGTIAWTEGLLFMAILFIPMFAAGIVLMVKSPELLKRRLDTREKEETQKTVILLSGLVFIAGFILAGLNYLYSWLVLPKWICWTGAVLFLIGYGLYAEVLRENAYLSRTVHVEKDQKVIDSGLYGIVRHPMYAVTILMFLSMPLVLGSLWSFILFLIYPAILSMRIKNEEQILKAELSGYDEYCTKVRYRLFPGIW